MNAPIENAAAKKQLILVAGDAERRRLIDEHPEAALVSNSLPLRANLSVIENITVVLQFHTNADDRDAADTAWELLVEAGHAGCVDQRDPDLSYEERFVAKLLRAIVLSPPLIVIDRPAQLLPDTNYPVFLDTLLAALENRFERCWIVDYAWNGPLYSSRA